MTIDISPKLLKRRRTKIVATLGPASCEPDAIARLIEAGVGVFRLNMSHGDQAWHGAALERIRAAADEAGEPVAVLGDLCGPKIRVGDFRNGSIELEQGGRVRVVLRDVPGEPGLIPLPYPPLAQDLQPGERLLLADGVMELVVDAVDADEITCTVVTGGTLSDRKGVNVPDSALSFSSFTDKDRDDARFLLEAGVDFLALSFVRSAADVVELKKCIQPAGRPVRVIAKIEKPEALQNIEAILDEADAIMVARGDLGVEMPAEAVPAAQDELVALARKKHKPSIIATQMLESMLHSPRPTRAEVSDIAHAVGAGTDALMLSGETAIGAHPVEAVSIMDRVIRQTEAGMWAASGFRSLSDDDEECGDVPTDEAVARAVSHLSRHLGARAILVLSRSGTSSMVVSSARPSAPLLAATANEQVCRLMNLFWGVVPVQVSADVLNDPPGLFRSIVGRLGLAEPGQIGLIVRGFVEGTAASEPSITVVHM